MSYSRFFHKWKVSQILSRINNWQQHYTKINIREQAWIYQQRKNKKKEKKKKIIKKYSRVFFVLFCFLLSQLLDTIITYRVASFFFCFLAVKNNVYIYLYILYMIIKIKFIYFFLWFRSNVRWALLINNIQCFDWPWDPNLRMLLIFSQVSVSGSIIHYKYFRSSTNEYQSWLIVKNKFSFCL